MARPEERVYDGLSKLAHAIRRSMALYVAALTLPPESSDDDLKAQAEDLAQWIGGTAQAQEDQQQESSKTDPLGQSWPPTD